MTYRLYDYGRPRELHLDDGIAVARAEPFPGTFHRLDQGDGTLVDGPHFTLVQSSGDALQDRLRWVMPVEGEASGAGPGDCLLVRPGERIDVSADARLLIGASWQS